MSASIERIRSTITTREIPISNNDIIIEVNLLNYKNTFNVNENLLNNLQSKFDRLNIAIKSFDLLHKI